MASLIQLCHYYFGDEVKKYFKPEAWATMHKELVWDLDKLLAISPDDQHVDDIAKADPEFQLAPNTTVEILNTPQCPDQETLIRRHMVMVAMILFLLSTKLIPNCNSNYLRLLIGWQLLFRRLEALPPWSLQFPVSFQIPLTWTFNGTSDKSHQQQV